MGKGLTIEELKEIFGMEQELDIPMKDRFHNQLTDEQISELTCTKGSYEAEKEEKGETDYKALEEAEHKLWQFFKDEHDLILTAGQLNDIVQAVNIFNDAVNRPKRA